MAEGVRASDKNGPTLKVVLGQSNWTRSQSDATGDRMDHLVRDVWGWEEVCAGPLSQLHRAPALRQGGGPAGRATIAAEGAKYCFCFAGLTFPLQSG